MEEKVVLDVEGLEGLGSRAEPLQTGKVVASESQTEAAVIGSAVWETIQQMRAEGRTVSAIARQFELDRKTVRRALKQECWKAYERSPASKTVLSEHMPWLIERAPKVRYSARILFQELRASRGYEGGYDTVKIAVRPLRALANVASLTQQRFETDPGHQAQVDWGQVRVRFADGPAEVHVFVMTLGYSRRSWAEGYVNERIEALLAAHEHAFAHFGGVCAELLYDRMRTVIQGTEDGKPRWNPRFEAFAAHWGFQPRVCRPYRARTKGKVESGVKYVKQNFVPGRTFGDLADFNEKLRTWLVEIADLRIHGTTHERPIDRFAREASLLAQLPAERSFVQAQRRERVVADDWLVSIHANRYSVPWRLIGKTVQVMRLGAHWQIRYRGDLVAEHPVLAGRYQLSVDPAHGPGALPRNVRTRFATPTPTNPSRHPLDCGVEVRDLAHYEQLLGVSA